MAEPVRGSCACGAVRFVCTPPPRFVCHCHCDNCRKAHGAGFVTWAWFTEAAFRLEAGEDRLGRWPTDTGATSFKRCQARFERHLPRAKVPSMLQLYTADVCPFAQRVQAVLAHLKINHDSHEIDLGDRNPEFLKLTPTGKVPLLVDGKLKLYESAVICEYLADVHAWADAYDEKPQIRARERLAMVTWDTTIAPCFYRGLQDGSLDKDSQNVVQAELKEFAQTVQAIGKRVGNLLSFHVAPFWVRMTWLRDLSPAADLVGEWIDVKSWLDATVAQPAIQATLPPREATVAAYRAKFRDE